MSALAHLVNALRGACTIVPALAAPRGQGVNRGALCVALALFASASAAAGADAYPYRPVRLVHGFSTGGNVDITARIVGAGMGEVLGQSVVIDMRPGAGGTVASGIVAASEADGYTLFVMPTGHTVAPNLYRKLPYDAGRDFTMITQLVTYPFLVAIGAATAMKSPADIMRAARAEPGKVSFGTAGVGTGMHLAALLFASRSGITLSHVPYKGGNTTGIGVAQGEVPFMFGNYSEIQPYLASGRIRVIAVTSADRWKRMPDVPTLAESGVPGYDVRAWLALAAPKGLGAARRSRLEQVAHGVLRRADLQPRFDDLGVIAAPTSGEDTQKLLQSELTRWRDVMRGAGIQPIQ